MTILAGTVSAPRLEAQLGALASRLESSGSLTPLLTPRSIALLAETEALFTGRLQQLTSDLADASAYADVELEFRPSNVADMPQPWAFTDAADGAATAARLRGQAEAFAAAKFTGGVDDARRAADTISDLVDGILHGGVRLP